MLAVAGSNVYAASEDAGHGARDIFLIASNNNGVSFNAKKFLSDNTGSSTNPDIAALGTKVAVIWEDKTGATGGSGKDILFRISNNNGFSFGSKINISMNSGDSKDPQVDFTPLPDGEIYAVLLDKSSTPARVHQPNGVYAVFAKESDNGVTFSSPAVILSDAANNPNLGKNAKLLQLDEHVAIWDPSGRRG